MLSEQGDGLTAGDICKFPATLFDQSRGAHNGGAMNLAGATVTMCIRNCKTSEVDEISVEILDAKCGSVCALIDTEVLGMEPGVYLYQFKASWPAGQNTPALLCHSPRDPATLTVGRNIYDSAGGVDAKADT